QYSRPTAKDGHPDDRRTPARNLCAVLDRSDGLVLVDVTEPELPRVVYPGPREHMRQASDREGDPAFRGLVLLSQIDLADPQRGERTAERDYAYVLSERLMGMKRYSTITLYDITDAPKVARRERMQAGNLTSQLVVTDYYSVPTRRRIAFTPG